MATCDVTRDVTGMLNDDWRTTAWSGSQSAIVETFAEHLAVTVFLSAIFNALQEVSKLWLYYSAY